MTEDKNQKKFFDQVGRGRDFEKWERSHWKEGINAEAKNEAQTTWKGKGGRTDIQLSLEEGQVVIVELKATNWDKMKENRVRANANRHANQIWRYINAQLDYSEVIPSIVYPAPPKTPGRLEVIETILNERGIQVVWRDEYSL